MRLRGAATDPARPDRAAGRDRQPAPPRTWSAGSPSGATAAAVAAVAVLVIVIWAVVTHGAKAISLDFITKAAPTGIGPDLVGTAVIVAIATSDRDADRRPDRALPHRVRGRRAPGRCSC